jgi:hypothetical protein
MFLGDGRVEHKTESDQRRWGKSSSETGIRKFHVGVN